jgi:phosphoribosylformylglycinamidine cyclo-ligase
MKRFSYKNAGVDIEKGDAFVQAIFSLLKEKGKIPDEEMLRTFNNGIGMILSVRSKEVEDILARLQTLGEKAYMIGEVGKTEKEEGTIEFV